MLTLAQLRKYGAPKDGVKRSAYNDLVSALNRGEITERDLRRKYSDFRKQIMSQIARIEKSDIKFLPGTAPTMRKASNLITTRDLIHEIATGLQFYHSKSYSKTQRREQRRLAIEKLGEHGIHIKESQWDEWRRFMQWFKSSSFAAIYDSDSAVTQLVFNSEAASTSQEWEALFLEWMKHNDAANYNKYMELQG